MMLLVIRVQSEERELSIHINNEHESVDCNSIGNYLDVMARRDYSVKLSYSTRKTRTT